MIFNAFDFPPGAICFDCFWSSESGGFKSQPLTLCRSSVSSEGTSEREKTDTDEEEKKHVPSPAEELVEAPPPAAPKTPAHLKKEIVRGEKSTHFKGSCVEVVEMNSLFCLIYLL